MNKIKLSILTLSLSLIFISCEESKTDSSSKEHDSASAETVTTVGSELVVIAKDVEANEFKTLFESGNGILVDVRTPGEVGQGSIEGNVNIDFNSGSFDKEISKLDKNVPVYVYCAAGGRSGSAMNKMKNMGFVEVYNLIGGYGRWPFK